MLVFAEIDPGMKGYGGAWGTERRPVTVSIFFIYSSILGSSGISNVFIITVVVNLATFVAILVVFKGCVVIESAAGVVTNCEGSKGIGLLEKLILLKLFFKL